jgi:hypothetical protein
MEDRNEWWLGTLDVMIDGALAHGRRGRQPMRREEERTPPAALGRNRMVFATSELMADVFK